MADKKQEILDVFRRKPGEEFSTTYIVSRVYSEDFLKLNNILNDKFSDERKKKNAKRGLASLHRKTLYYLNTMVNEDLLKETSIGKKNEKCFTLNLDVLAATSQGFDEPVPVVPIEGYMERGITHRLDEAGWVERVNCVLIEGSVVENLNELNKLTAVSMKNVNDVVGINDFEMQINRDTISFLRKLNSRFSDYGRQVCLIIDFTNLVDSNVLFKLVSDVLDLKLNNLTFIFDVQPREFQDNSDFFEKLIKLYQEFGKEIYIKNQGVHKAPYVLGKAGPYTFSEKEWATYKSEVYGRLKGIALGQSTVMVDADSFIKEPNFNSDEFNRLMKKISESFLIINSIQRRKAENYFSGFVRYGSMPKEILFLAKDYIRFWNYGWKRKNLEQEMLIEAIKKKKEAVNNFCIYEETIYKSCGMPVRFKIAFSCAAMEFIKNFFSKPKYMQFYIEDIKDFYKPEVKEILRTKEKIFEIFDGGDLISFYKRSNYNAEDIMREISFILGTYKIPFFRYSFLQKFNETEQTLMRFIQ